MNFELLFIFLLFPLYSCQKNSIRKKYTTDEEDYTTNESITFVIRFNQTITTKSQAILTGLTYDNINYRFNIENSQPIFVLSKINQSDLVLTSKNQSESIRKNHWYRFNVQRTDRKFIFKINDLEQSIIELPRQWEGNTNIFIGAELTPLSNDDADVEITNITVKNSNRSVKLHEDEELPVISTNITQTIAFLPDNNNEILFPSPIKSFFKTLSFSFRTYSNSCTLIQFEEISLSIDINGSLILGIQNRQNQLIFSKQSINNGYSYNVQFEFLNQTLHVWIDNYPKTSTELFSSYLILENFLFGPKKRFYGCIENLTYNQQIFSFEHLPLDRQQCPIDDPPLNRMISFREFDLPLIIQLNNSQVLTRFSFRFFTKEFDVVLCSFNDQSYENILLFYLRNKQIILTYIQNNQTSIEIILNSSISDENLIEFDHRNLLFSLPKLSITKIFLGQIDPRIQTQHVNLTKTNFFGCMKDFMFNNKSLLRLEHIDQLERLTNTCQIVKRERRHYMPSNISFSIRNSNEIVRIPISTKDHLKDFQLTIKTRSRSGIIFSLDSTEKQSSLILSLKNGQLQLNEYVLNNQTSNLIYMDQNQTINNGREYSILLSNQIFKTISSKTYLQIALSSRFSFDSLILGGSSKQYLFLNQLIGCFSNITYNHNPMIPEDIMKSDRYDCFYDRNSLCNRANPCREEYCGENDCSLVCIPPIIEQNQTGLLQYQTQIKSGQYEQIYLTIFTTSGNSTLFMTNNETSQVSIILQDFYPRLIIQNGGIIYTYDFPGRIRGDQWHILQCQKTLNTLDLTFDDEIRHYTNLSEYFSLFANDNIHICGKDFIGYVQDIILMSDNHHENLIQNSISNPGLIDFDQSVTWNNRADIPKWTPCERIQCLNGGYCIQPATPKTIAYCHCPSQYTGYRCEQAATVDPCSNYQCNHGACQKDRNNQPYCSCYEGYGGSRCETQIDPCAKVNCNYGRCEVDRSRPICRCYQGYTGHECLAAPIDACARVSCNYGTCINEGTSYRCECQRGYEGAACDRQIDPCTNFVCYHGGACYTQEHNQPVCQCAPGYRGVNCYEADVDPCARYDCYGGTCTNDRGTARCICPTGRAGPRCQDDICVLYPCANNGQCVPEASTRRCICSTPYYGDDCRDVYRPNPCDNIYCGYGECREGSCECHGGYTGVRCDVAPDLCAAINCNYGLCEEGRCACNAGYTGAYCDTPTTTATPVPIIAQTPRPVLTPQTVGLMGPKKGQLIDYGRLVGARAGPVGWILPLLAGLLLLPLALAFAARKCATGGCLPGGGTRGYVPVTTGAAQNADGAGNRATRDLELIDQRGDALTASSGGFQTERIEQTREIVREYGGMETAGGVFTSYPTVSSGHADFVQDNQQQQQQQQQQSSSAHSQQHIIETDYHAPPVADFGYNRGGAVTEGYRDTFESWETAGGGGGGYSMNAMFADGGLQTDYELSNINSVSMTPNGKYAIVGQSQGPPQIWDAVNGQLVSSMQGISNNCSKVALACSGTLLVGLASDGIDAQPSILQIWDVNTGKPVQLTHQIKCATFTLSNNSNNLVMAGNQKYGRGISVGILDLNNSELTKEIKSDTNQSYGNTPSFITLTPDERYAIVGCSAGSTTNYVVFDLTTPHEIVQPPLITLDADPKTSLVLNNEQMLTGTRNGQVILWNIPSCQRILSLNDNGQSAHRDRITDLKISPDQSFFVTTSADGTAKVWDTNSKELISRLIGHKREITCVCVSTNQLVATGSKDQNICLWRAPTGQIASTMPVAMTPLDIHMAAHNRTIVAIGDKDGERQLLMLRVVSVQR